MSAGRHAAVGPRELRPARRSPTSRGNAGDVGAVAIIVQVGCFDEALPVDDPRSQVGVRIDAAVDDGDAHARASVAGLVRQVGMGGGGSQIERTEYRPIERNIGNPWV